MQAVSISLSSALSALGNNPSDLRDKLCQDDGFFCSNHELLARPIWVGAYDGVLADDCKDSLFDSRNLRFAITALQSIKTPLHQLTQGLPKHRLAIVLGTSTSGISDNQSTLKTQIAHQQPSPLPHPKQAMNALALGVQAYLGWQGICYTISTACSSAGKALATAQRLLNTNMADVVLAGGVDSLCPLTLNGFDSLESLSASTCTPCGENRDGINIGESASLFVLTKDPTPVMLLSSGESMDAWHISAPHPQGQGANVAMTKALQSANLSAQDIDYLNMHGTGTPQNDAMETLAISQVFADHPTLPLSSTKHKTGHCLGASAGIEAYICQQLLQSQKVWLPYHHAGVIDPTLPPLNYVRPHTVLPTHLRHVMSNNFAFGGSNVSLIFAKGES